MILYGIKKVKELVNEYVENKLAINNDENTQKTNEFIINELSSMFSQSLKEEKKESDGFFDELSSYNVDFNREMLSLCAENGITDFFKSLINNNIVDSFHKNNYISQSSYEVKALIRGHKDTYDFIDLHSKYDNEYYDCGKGIPLQQNIDKNKIKPIGGIISAILYSENDKLFDQYISMLKNKNNITNNKEIENDNMTTALCITISSQSLCKDKKISFIKKVIDAGIKINGNQNDYIVKALSLIMNKHCSIVEISDLITDKFGIDLFKKTDTSLNEDKQYPIYNIVSKSFSHSSEETVDYLLDKAKKNKNTSIDYGSFGESPMHWACLRFNAYDLVRDAKNIDCTDLEKNINRIFNMIQDGFDYNQKTENGLVPTDLINCKDKKIKDDIVSAIGFFIESFELNKPDIKSIKKDITESLKTEHRIIDFITKYEKIEFKEALCNSTKTSAKNTTLKL